MPPFLDFNYVTVATFDSVADEMIWMSDIVWPSGKVPVDGIPEFVESTVDEIEQIIPASVHLVISSAAVVGIILTLLTAFFVICLSKKPIVSASNPPLLCILLFGLLLMYSSVIFTKSRLLPPLEESQHLLLCKIQSTSSSIGFILCVSVLASKMWRVYKANWVYKKSEVESEWWLGFIVFISLGVDISLLILNRLLYPLEIAKVILTQKTDPTNPNHQTILYVTICSATDQFIPVLLSVLDKAALVLVGLFLTIEIRQVKKVSCSLLDDSQLVAASIYNIIIFATCGLILAILLQNSTTNSYVFSSALVLCCSTSTLVVMFVPKIFHVITASLGDTWVDTHDTTLSTMASTSVSPIRQ
ncbi:Gamma-aminobutyric acid type B receptor subunit 2 [Holothuria leucospilota]|uniref:Gamma-aminobutyric acid type B receptor subunit 2 n=1 Tax=Holothuria leucospilota TaxID=206669 RepID=A0A9Q1CGP3_HOLLE|nr:Gamma-aminobutyric acid type B receptor subunit 2 [Holothuria leucospilota]